MLQPMLHETTEGPTIRIPRSQSLEQRIAKLKDVDRPAYVQGIKDLRKADCDRIRQAQIDRINELTGLDVVTGLTVQTDTVIKDLARRAFEKAGAPDNCWDMVGIFALGGYGRGELAPFSDIDLLVLHTGRFGVPDWLTKANNELQTLMWDVGFQVGASMRAVPELDTIIREDFVTATAVLEQRLLLGGEAIDAALRKIREKFSRKRSTAFLRYKIEELEERRGKAGASLYLMEPNLKTNPGCLRDIQLLRNIGFIVFGSRNLHALRELGVITFDDVQGLFGANDALHANRCLLHFHHGMHEDHLRLQDQLWLAELLGFAKGGRFTAVEQMMRQHYERVSHVHENVELVISRLQALGHLGRRKILVKTRKKFNKDAVSIDGRIFLSAKDYWDQPYLGRRLLELHRQAQKRKMRLSIELQRHIKARLFNLFHDSFRDDADSARAFLDILGEPGQCATALQDMHNSGLLGAYLPEFGNLTCLLQFNSYHQYTADEHTLLAMRHLDRLVLGESEGFPHCQEIVKRVERLDLLALSLLLHDMGKFMGSGHVARGALMVHPVAKRMGLNEEEEDLVHFLVDQHVVLSDASRFRDIHDPAFQEEMVEALGTQERLELLYVLTWCDAIAVGENILTGWQIALMGELYEALSRAIRRKTELGRIPSKRTRIVEALRGAGKEPEFIDAFLASLPSAYRYQAMPEDVVSHLALLEQAREGGGLAIDRRVDGESAWIFIAAQARTGLIAMLSAALAGANFDIVEARVWQSKAGDVVLHQFRITCPITDRLTNDRIWKTLQQTMHDLEAGSLDAEMVLEKRQGFVGADKPADSGFDGVEVRIDQALSDRSTVIDVRVKDSPGLLHHICRTLNENGCDLFYTSISTYGDVARDVFYVTKDGQKLDSATASRIRRLVHETLVDLQQSDASRDSGIIRY